MFKLCCERGIRYSTRVFTNMWNSGADLGGGCRGRAPPPPLSEMKPSSSYSLLKFVCLTGQWRHSLGAPPPPPPKKNPASAPETLNVQKCISSHKLLWIYYCSSCYCLGVSSVCSIVPSKWIEPFMRESFRELFDDPYPANRQQDTISKVIS